MMMMMMMMMMIRRRRRRKGRRERRREEGEEGATRQVLSRIGGTGRGKASAGQGETSQLVTVSSLGCPSKEKKSNNWPFAMGVNVATGTSYALQTVSDDAVQAFLT
jgi:hypothetical protein